jgi:flavin reductase (DIM6/NTAB) family NADH-FMN oxidoreductase RutF
MMNPARKKALRLLTYGIYVVTARDGEHYAAGTITWLSQSSFDPPLVMAAFQKKSSLHRAVSGSGAFAVNIVGAHQQKLATSFFKSARREGNLLNGYRFAPGETGSPILEDAPAWFECRVGDAVRRGDHTIFVAEVVAAGVRREEKPLALADLGLSYGG